MPPDSKYLNNMPGLLFLMGLEDKMDAIILAAGYGTRLYPLTENKPKALLEINNKTIMDYLMGHLEQIAELDNIYLVSNARFYEQFMKWKEGKLFSKKIHVLNNNTISNETRLGAVGDINFALGTANINNDVLITASDSIFEFSIADFVNFFREKNTSIIGCEYQSDKERLKSCSVIEHDQDYKVLSFEEKPKEPKGNTGGVPIYLLKKEVLHYIPETLKTIIGPMGRLIQALLENKEILHTFRIPTRHHFTTVEDYHKLSKKLSASKE